MVTPVYPKNLADLSRPCRCQCATANASGYCFDNVTCKGVSMGGQNAGGYRSGNIDYAQHYVTFDLFLCISGEVQVPTPDNVNCSIRYCPIAQQNASWPLDDYCITGIPISKVAGTLHTFAGEISAELSGSLDPAVESCYSASIYLVCPDCGLDPNDTQPPSRTGRLCGRFNFCCGTDQTGQGGGGGGTPPSNLNVLLSRGSDTRNTYPTGQADAPGYPVPDGGGGGPE